MYSEVPDMQSAARTFFSSPHFAVAGASNDAAKFGHKIFCWYIAHDLSATPLNPRAPNITALDKDFDTVASPSKLPNAGQTSLSIVTPPKVTREVLKEAKEAGIRAVWMQPGTFGEEEMAYAVKEFPGAAVGGKGNGTRGGEGWCVLVDGEKALKEAEREGKL